MKIYTRRGDDGTTGLLYGGRVGKDSAAPTAYGSVDEAQAFIGAARAQTQPGELDELLVHVEHDLWVLMAELATNPERRDRGQPGQSLVTTEMVTELEQRIDDVMNRFQPPKDFVVPGANPVSAALDVARTVVRRAERAALSVAGEGSHVVPYLNRCSDLLWALARWQEGESLLAKDVSPPQAQ
ncbi:MAG: cob(I)yrinic acid a,c-diamide adenosyltransferase [Jiangellaceae bacterium]|nr:cob(I)yrinic acid a,c-diamide adenosyltransferase [Jiangellaceae bacterium]